MALWEWIALSLHCWVLAVAAGSDQHAISPFDWLLSDKGPFHRSPEYTDFVDRSRQGFSTRYKIYRYEAFGITRAVNKILMHSFQKYYS
uniref:Uncharacterized protein n=1 Tax=Laticauda laticaudata TaxID=8630 RepID=A0A8C5RJU7_LATLA